MNIETVKVLYAKSTTTLNINIDNLKELLLYQNIHSGSMNPLKEAEALVKINLSYDESKYETFSAFTLYDSKCRNCENTGTSLKEVIDLVTKTNRYK